MGHYGVHACRMLPSPRLGLRSGSSPATMALSTLISAWLAGLLGDALGGRVARYAEQPYTRRGGSGRAEPPVDVAGVRKAAGPLLEGADHTIMTLGTTLTFGGGVTAGWVMERLQEWDEMTRAARRRTAPRPRRKAR